MPPPANLPGAGPQAGARYDQTMSSFVHAMIPVAIGATFIVLCIGIYALFRGGRFNRSYSNLLMRWRILLQFIAICLIALAGLVLGK
jgi:hypothetical protein